MLEWIYNDKSGGRWSETDVGLKMVEASMEERVVRGVNQGASLCIPMGGGSGQV